MYIYIHTYFKAYYPLPLPPKPNSREQGFCSLGSSRISAIESNISGTGWTTRTTDPCLLVDLPSPKKEF